MDGTAGQPTALRLRSSLRFENVTLPHHLQSAYTPGTLKDVKKRDLMKHLREIADSAGAELVFLRQGKHEVWSLGGERLYIPRHREISRGVAASIMKRARSRLR